MVVVRNKDMILTVFTVPETGNAKIKDPERFENGICYCLT